MPDVRDGEHVTGLGPSGFDEGLDAAEDDARHAARPPHQGPIVSDAAVAEVARVQAEDDAAGGPPWDRPARRGTDPGRFPVEIRPTAGGGHALLIGGVDISSAVEGCVITVGATGRPIMVTLSLPRARLDAAADRPALVRFDTETYRALVHLGWRPPAGQ